MLVRLQTEPIRADDLMAAVTAPGDGAVALFLGTVRGTSRGRRVLRLEYHAYDEMAQAELARLAQECRARHAVSRVAIVHRTGRLEIGEVSVGVAVAAAHRAEALAACRFVIDTLKVRVPIWKKELYADGEVWIEGAGAGRGPVPDQP